MADVPNAKTFAGVKSFVATSHSVPVCILRLLGGHRATIRKIISLVLIISVSVLILPSTTFADYSEESLRDLGATLSAQGDSSGVQDGGTLTINGESLGSFDYVVIDGDTTIASGWTVGDYFSATEDSKAAVVVINGDLTINSGEIFTPNVRKLFTLIYVTGDLTVEGEISMTARGADHSVTTGSNIAAAAVRIADGTYSGVTDPEVPAAGGSGAAAKTTAFQVGGAGANGSGGGTGGGGSGAIGNTTGPSGAGADGSAFSGGPGGGGSAGGAAGDGASDGGPGGDGSSSFTGGGGGNPGGDSHPNGGVDGSDGTGGVLVVVVLGTLSGAGNISADGADGGGGGVTSNGGGGSGGGSTTVLYGADSSSITPTANGGAGGDSTRDGGSGGVGTARKLKIPTPRRILRLFEGFKIRFTSGKIILYEGQ